MWGWGVWLIQDLRLMHSCCKMQLFLNRTEVEFRECWLKLGRNSDQNQSKINFQRPFVVVNWRQMKKILTKGTAKIGQTWWALIWLVLEALFDIIILLSSKHLFYTGKRRLCNTQRIARLHQREGLCCSRSAVRIEFGHAHTQAPQQVSQSLNMLLLMMIMMMCPCCVMGDAVAIAVGWALWISFKIESRGQSSLNISSFCCKNHYLWSWWSSTLRPPFRLLWRSLSEYGHAGTFRNYLMRRRPGNHTPTFSKGHTMAHHTETGFFQQKKKRSLNVIEFFLWSAIGQIVWYDIMFHWLTLKAPLLRPHRGNPWLVGNCP